MSRRGYDDEPEMVEVSGELRPYPDDKPSWAIWCGEMREAKNGQQEEVWVFLPKSKCQQGDNKNTWMVPIWIVREKNLI